MDPEVDFRPFGQPKGSVRHSFGFRNKMAIKMQRAQVKIDSKVNDMRARAHDKAHDARVNVTLSVAKIAGTDPEDGFRASFKALFHAKTWTWYNHECDTASTTTNATNPTSAAFVKESSSEIVDNISVNSDSNATAVVTSAAALAAATTAAAAAAVVTAPATAPAAAISPVATAPMAAKPRSLAAPAAHSASTANGTAAWDKACETQIDHSQKNENVGSHRVPSSTAGKSGIKTGLVVHNDFSVSGIKTPKPRAPKISNSREGKKRLRLENPYDFKTIRNGFVEPEGFINNKVYPVPQVILKSPTPEPEPFNPPKGPRVFTEAQIAAREKRHAKTDRLRSAYYRMEKEKQKAYEKELEDERKREKESKVAVAAEAIILRMKSKLGKSEAKPKKKQETKALDAPNKAAAVLSSMVFSVMTGFGKKSAKDCQRMKAGLTSIPNEECEPDSSLVGALEVFEVPEISGVSEVPEIPEVSNIHEIPQTPNISTVGEVPKNEPVLNTFEVSEATNCAAEVDTVDSATIMAVNEAATSTGGSITELIDVSPKKKEKYEKQEPKKNNQTFESDIEEASAMKAIPKSSTASVPVMESILARMATKPKPKETETKLLEPKLSPRATNEVLRTPWTGLVRFVTASAPKSAPEKNDSSISSSDEGSASPRIVSSTPPTPVPSEDSVKDEYFKVNIQKQEKAGTFSDEAASVVAELLAQPEPQPNSQFVETGGIADDEISKKDFISEHIDLKKAQSNLPEIEKELPEPKNLGELKNGPKKPPIETVASEDSESSRTVSFNPVEQVREFLVLTPVPEPEIGELEGDKDVSTSEDYTNIKDYYKSGENNVLFTEKISSASIAKPAVKNATMNRVAELFKWKAAKSNIPVSKLPKEHSTQSILKKVSAYDSPRFEKVTEPESPLKWSTGAIEIYSKYAHDQDVSGNPEIQISASEIQNKIDKTIKDLTSLEGLPVSLSEPNSKQKSEAGPESGDIKIPVDMDEALQSNPWLEHLESSDEIFTAMIPVAETISSLLQSSDERSGQNQRKETESMGFPQPEAETLPQPELKVSTAETLLKTDTKILPEGTAQSASKALADALPDQECDAKQSLLDAPPDSANAQIQDDLEISSIYSSINASGESSIREGMKKFFSVQSMTMKNLAAAVKKIKPKSSPGPTDETWILEDDFERTEANEEHVNILEGLSEGFNDVEKGETLAQVRLDKVYPLLTKTGKESLMEAAAYVAEKASEQIKAKKLAEKAQKAAEELAVTREKIANLKLKPSDWHKVLDDPVVPKPLKLVDKWRKKKAMVSGFFEKNQVNSERLFLLYQKDFEMKERLGFELSLMSRRRCFYHMKTDPEFDDVEAEKHRVTRLDYEDFEKKLKSELRNRRTRYEKQREDFRYLNPEEAEMLHLLDEWEEGPTDPCGISHYFYEDMYSSVDYY